MIEWLETTLNGLMLGGLYALFGLGLSLIFGVMKIANIAHGEIVITGAFLSFTILPLFPLPIWLLVIIVALVMFIIGYVLQTAFLNRVMSDDPLPSLLLTFGLSIVIQNIFVELYGADNRAINLNDLSTRSLQFGDLSVGILPLGTLFISFALFGLVQWMIAKTKWGRIVRATSDDFSIVSIMGVERKHVFATVMGLSAALAAIAGILLAMRTSVTPFSGVERLLIAFEVIVIGGLGSIWVSLLGGLVLGLVHAISFKLDPASGLLYGHILLIVILLLKPNGLAGKVRSR